MDKQYFSTTEAAKYLGISLGQMKYYIHKVKEIRPELIGNSLVFTRIQLDEFKPGLTDRKPGRKRKVLPEHIMKMLGKAPDGKLAQEVGVNPRTIKRFRDNRGIEPYQRL